MRPDIMRWDGPLTDVDDSADDDRRAVARALALGRLPIADWQAPGLGDALDEARARLGLPMPGPAAAEPGTPESRAADPLPAKLRARAIDLRERLQDDWALLAPDTNGARAVCFAVATPSGWDPAEKIGLDFAAIHEPVPDAPSLTRAGATLARLLLREGPFRRHVWTLATSAQRSQHPADIAGEGSGTEDAPIQFRCERQTTVPLPASGFALFLIRVYVAPLQQVLAVDPARRELLAESLRSMSDGVVRYKRLEALRERVLRGDT